MFLNIHTNTNTDECLKVQDIGRSEPLTLNEFFDPSTPSMRKGHGGEKKIMVKIAVH